MYNGNKNIHQFKVGIYSRYKQEWKDVGERRIFARSKWEHYYAIYLDSLRKQGQILDWEHETKEFWFDKIKRGVRSYKPDFLVLHKNGEEELIEVKCYMDAKSATKIKRMGIYFPNVKLRIVDATWFKANNTALKILVSAYENKKI
jgi:hypothetical protein